MSLVTRTIATKGDGKLIGSTDGSNKQLPHHQSGLSSTPKPLVQATVLENRAACPLQSQPFSQAAVSYGAFCPEMSLCLLFDRATLPSSDDSGQF